MATNNKQVLSLFFTRGMSLHKWDEIGVFDREIAVYNSLSNYFSKIYFYTYGGKMDQKFVEKLNQNIEIVYASSNINKTLYSFILPFLHLRKIRESTFLKTDQMDGSWSAVVAKLITRRKLIIRTGYTWSKFFANASGKSKYFLDRLKYFLIDLIEKFAYHFADHVIVSSNHDKAYLLNKYHLDGKNISVISNYIDTNVFKPLDLEKNEDLIFVGRLSEQKNILNFLSSIRGENFKITLVGSGHLENEILNFAQKYHLHIKIINQIANHDLPKILSAHKIFILPSRYEGMPKALLEAMSVGLAVVATDVEGNNEIIMNDQNGILINPDFHDVKNIINKLLFDEQKRKSLGKMARETILNKYSLTDHIKQEIEIYEKFIK